MVLLYLQTTKTINHPRLKLEFLNSPLLLLVTTHYYASSLISVHTPVFGWKYFITIHQSFIALSSNETHLFTKHIYIRDYS